MSTIVLSTPLKIQDFKNSKSLQKDIIVTCSCESISHTMKLTFYRSIEDNKIIEDISYFQLSAQDCIYPNYDIEMEVEKSKFKRFIINFKFLFKRIKACFNLILNKPLYGSCDVWIDSDGIKKLSTEIISTLKELDKESKKIAKNRIEHDTKSV